MKVVGKINICDVELYKKAGYIVKILPLPLAEQLFGSEVFVNCGDTVYISAEIDVEMDELLGVKVARL